MAFSSLVRLHFQHVITYRAHFLLSLLSGPLYFSVQYFVWSALLAGGAVAGFELQTIVTYFVLAMLLQYWHFDYSDYDVQRFVREGTLNGIILRPLTLHTWLFSKKIASRGLAVLLEVLPLSLFAMAIFGVSVLTPHGDLAAFAALLVIVFILRFALAMLIGHAAFWMTNIHGLRMLMIPIFLFMAGSLFPLNILPLWAQHIAFWMPTQFFVYAPASVFLGNYALAGHTDVWSVVLLGIGWVVVIYLLLWLVQRRAQYKYEGVGQ